MAQGPARIASGSSAWVDITGKPSTFPPSAHTQAWSTITTTPTTLSGYGITDAQGLDADLTALAGLSTTGIVARTGTGTAAARTITGTADQVIVANGDGVSGNPTLSLPQSIATTSTPQFTRLGIGKAADATKAIDAMQAIHSTVSGGSNASNIYSYGGRAAVGLYSANGTSGSPSAWTAGAGLDKILMYGYGTTTFGEAIVQIAAVATEDHSDTNKGTYLSFQTTATGGTMLAEVMQLRDAKVRFSGYGAGTLVTDSSGNVTASSDRRLKNVSGKFTRGLAAIMEIQPKVFTWKPESGMNPDDVNVGFIAQDVQPAIPEAVGSMKTVDTEEDDGTGKKVKKSKREASEFLTLSDRPIIAALVNAVKELKAENDDLRARVSALEKGKASK